MVDTDWATKNMKKILIGGGSICVILIILLVSPGGFDFINGVEQEALINYKPANGISADLIQDSLIEYRQGVFKSDTLRTLGFSLVTLLVLFLGIKSIVKFKYLLIALSVLVFADMYSVNTIYFNNEKVGTGIYLVFSTDHDGYEKMVSKILFIKWQVMKVELFLYCTTNTVKGL